MGFRYATIISKHLKYRNCQINSCNCKHTVCILKSKSIIVGWYGSKCNKCVCEYMNEWFNCCYTALKMKLAFVNHFWPDPSLPVRVKINSASAPLLLKYGGAMTRKLQIFPRFSVILQTSWTSLQRCPHGISCQPLETKKKSRSLLQTNYFILSCMLTSVYLNTTLSKS